MTLRSRIVSTQDFPKPGVLFWDFTPLLEDPAAFASAIDRIMRRFSRARVTRIAAIEAKGFTIAGALAHAWKKPLVLIRKPGLIPGAVVREPFVKEYGEGAYEMKAEACARGDRVLIVYDILAAPGATEAAIRLVENAGATVVGCAYVIELEYLRARSSLAKFHPFSLVKIKQRRDA